jgi:ABC-type Fe3+-hydroxamate transport system substrate-binding protein
VRTVAACFLAALWLGGCAGSGSAGREPGTGAQRTAAGWPRIVSLAPSLTEIAYAIGCGPELVGDTSFDDYPQAATRLPHVADLVTVDLERLSMLAATQVIALHDQEGQAAPVRRQLHIPVIFLPNRDLTDLFVDIEGVGQACRRTGQARELARSLREQLSTLGREAANYRTKPKVFFLFGLPGFTAGRHSFVDGLISLAGGVNVAGSIPQPYPDVGAEWLLQADPDVIVVAREAGFGADVRAREPWRDMRAVRAGRIVEPPSDDVLERDGPRIVEGLHWLIHAIHKP